MIDLLDCNKSVYSRGQFFGTYLCLHYRKSLQKKYFKIFICKQIFKNDYNQVCKRKMLMDLKIRKEKGQCFYILMLSFLVFLVVFVLNEALHMMLFFGGLSRGSTCYFGIVRELRVVQNNFCYYIHMYIHTTPATLHRIHV